MQLARRYNHENTKKILSTLFILSMIFGLTACGSSQNEPNLANTSKPSDSSDESRSSNTHVSTDSSNPITKGGANASVNSSGTTRSDTQLEKNKETKIKITVGKQVLTATLIDNATTRSLISKFPLTVPMMDLYSREMCYRFPDELPTDNVQTTSYEVGEIVYWPPRHSFVILYAQNGERFDMQKIGRIDSGVEIFEKTGDVDVAFELLDK